MTDKGFSNEMRDMLEIASNLLRESNTEETRIYVQQKLRDMRTLLQHKQIQGEYMLEESIRKENEGIKLLEDRINALNAGTVQEAESLDYQQMYLDLKENEWMEAFHALLENKNRSIETILQHLIDILKITYLKCHTLQARHNMELSVEAIWAGDKPKGKADFEGLTGDQVKELKVHVNYCQSKTAQYCIESISKKLFDEVKSDSEIMKKYKKQSERVVTAFDDYINKCIQFSWLTQFESPPIHLVTAPKTECPPIMDQFLDRKLVTYAKLVEWPALVQGQSLKEPTCTVRIPWQLYEKSQTRPQARPQRIPSPPTPKPDIPRAEISTELNEDSGYGHTDTTLQVGDNMAIYMPHTADNVDTEAYRSMSSETGVVPDDKSESQVKPRERKQTAVDKSKGDQKAHKDSTKKKKVNVPNVANKDKGRDVRHPQEKDSMNF